MARLGPYMIVIVLTILTIRNERWIIFLWPSHFFSHVSVLVKLAHGHARLIIVLMSPVHRAWHVCLNFEVEPSTHLFLVQQYLREAACLAYPAQTVTIKRQGLSEQTVCVLRSKVHISNVCIRTSLFLRNAGARACFYLWRSWRNDLSRAKYCPVRGFSRKALCMRQLFSRAAERSIRARLASLLELEHLAKLSAKADSAEAKVISEDPITLFRYVSPLSLPNKNQKILPSLILLAAGLNTRLNFVHMYKT